MVVIDNDKDECKKDPDATISIIAQKTSLTKQQILNQFNLSTTGAATKTASAITTVCKNSSVIPPTVLTTSLTPKMENGGFIISQAAPNQAPTLIPIFSKNANFNNNNINNNFIRGGPIPLVPSGSVILPPIAGPIPKPLSGGQMAGAALVAPIQNINSNQPIQQLLPGGTILLGKPPIGISNSANSSQTTLNVDVSSARPLLGALIDNKSPGSSICMMSPAIPYQPPSKVSVKDSKELNVVEKPDEGLNSKKSILSDLFSDLTEMSTEPSAVSPSNSSISLTSFQTHSTFTPPILEANTMPKEILNSFTNPIVLSPDNSPTKSNITQVASKQTDSMAKLSSSISIQQIKEESKVSVSSVVSSSIVSKSQSVGTTETTTQTTTTAQPKTEENGAPKPEYQVLKGILAFKDKSGVMRKIIPKAAVKKKSPEKKPVIESPMDKSISLDIAQIKSNMAEAEKRGTVIKSNPRVQFKKGQRKKVIQHAENSFVKMGTRKPEDTEGDIGNAIDSVVNSESDTGGLTESSREVSPVKKNETEDEEIKIDNYCTLCCKAFKSNCNFEIKFLCHQKKQNT